MPAVPPLSGARHRRTPSVPLKVRAASVSHGTTAYTSQHLSESILLSPSSAELPSALPKSPELGASERSARPAEGTSSAAAASNSSEKYGFVVYVGSLLAWWLYLFWAFTPDAYLKQLGLEWYPNREWAVLVPSWIMVSVVYAYVAYFALNLYHTPALDSLTTLVDTQAHLLPRKRDVAGRSSALPAYDINADLGFEEDYIPPLYDLPAGMINRALFDDTEG